MVAELNATAERVSEAFGQLTHLTVAGHPLSPVKHLYLASEQLPDGRERELSTLRRIVDECMKSGLALTTAEYLEEKERSPCPRPSLRIGVNRQLSADDVRFAVETLERVSKEVLRDEQS